MFKECSKCKRSASVFDFYIDKSKKEGRRGECKKCSNQYREEYRKKNNQKQRKWNSVTEKKNAVKRKGYKLKYRFKLTNDEYESKLIEQSGR